MKTKKNDKRRIPKEGMPHAQKTCKNKGKKKMHTQRRYATCPQGMSKEKERERERERKIVHIQEK